MAVTMGPLNTDKEQFQLICIEKDEGESDNSK